VLNEADERFRENVPDGDVGLEVSEFHNPRAFFTAVQ
jgi:hypothetical protein